MQRNAGEVALEAPSRSVRAWVGVVSRAHVHRGVAGGFAQLCHGKQSPLARLSVGDWLVYYSPTNEFPDGAPLRAFTALGRVVGDAAYRFDMGGGFVPYRRDVAYLKSAREVPIRDLAAELEFVRGRPSWGMLARRGHFEISLDDLRTIAVAMGARMAVSTRPLTPSACRRSPARTGRTASPLAGRRRAGSGS